MSRGKLVKKAVATAEVQYADLPDLLNRMPETRFEVPYARLGDAMEFVREYLTLDSLRAPASGPYSFSEWERSTLRHAAKTVRLSPQE